MTLPKRNLITNTSSDTVADAMMAMKDGGVSQLPVLDGGRLVGVVTESDLLSKMVEGNASLSSAVAEVMFRNVETVNVQEDASCLTALFGRGYVALVVDNDQRLKGILTKMDLVDHLTGTPDAKAKATS